MRTCPICMNEKPDTDFYPRKNGKPQAYCKKCFSAYMIGRWIQKKKDAVQYKGGVCVDCHEQMDYYLYDFHHLDPSKKDVDWNKLRLRSWGKIMKELDKCVLLCCKCHRIREHQLKVVVPVGFEPTADRLKGGCSS